MPYIKQYQRVLLDKEITALAEQIKKISGDNQDGALNYAVTKLLKELYPPSYFNYNRSMGVLSCIQAEWYRRAIATYEDTKAEENGDV